MTRSEQREQAFILIFETLFDSDDNDEMITKFENTLNEKLKKFARDLYFGTRKNIEYINSTIKEHLKNWDENRISKASLAILQLAIYEIIYESDIPPSVSVNEAVELAKKYGKDDDPSFVNGLLGSIVKENS